MLFATTGARFYIGGTAAMPSALLTAASFSGESWVEVKALESLGSAGVDRETVDQTTLNSPVAQVMKDKLSHPPMEITTAIDPDDAGQTAMYAAAVADGNYSFRLSLPEGSKRYFIGTVTRAVEVMDQASSVTKMNFAIAINSNIVKVPAP